MNQNTLQAYIHENSGINLLSERLTAIASYVEQDAVVADIGTDHGYIPIMLAKAGIIHKGYAMDINQGPLDKARGNILAYHVEDQIDTVISDGLNNMADPSIDNVVIAGMGGMLIVRILEDGKDKLQAVRRLILSPHHDVEAVRRKVHSLGFVIAHEAMVQDGQFYNILVCEHGLEAYESDMDYRYGQILLQEKPKVFVAFLEKKLEQIQQILLQLADNDNCTILERKHALEKEYDVLREVIGDDESRRHR